MIFSRSSFNPAVSMFWLGGLFVFQPMEAFGQQADELVWSGRKYIERGEFSHANQKFQQAVTRFPQHEEANFFLGITRLLLLSDSLEFNEMLDRLNIDADGREIMDWTAGFQLNEEGSIVINNSISGEELANYFYAVLVKELRLAANNWARITSDDFLVVLTEKETGWDSIPIDRGDVLLIRAAAEFIYLISHNINALDIDIPVNRMLDEIEFSKLTAESILLEYNDLFEYDHPDEMILAQEAFSHALDLYLQASSVIRNRPNGAVRLFNLDEQGKRMEALFREELNLVNQSLINSIGHNEFATPIKKYIDNYSNTDDDDAFNSIDFSWPLRADDKAALRLGSYFDPNNAPRSWLPTIEDNRVVLGTWPDSTFGGIIEGVSGLRLESYIGLRNLTDWIPVMKIPPKREFDRIFWQVETFPGISYGLERSYDLVDWSMIDSKLSQTNQIIFSDFYHRDIEVFYRSVATFNPANDDFSKAYEIDLNLGFVQARFDGASSEPSDPENILPRSVWWKMTSYQTQAYLVTIESNMFSKLDVFTLDPTGNIQWHSSKDVTRKVQEIVAEEGVTYYIAASSYTEGPFKLKWKSN